jgi:hypothetical protein
MTPTNMLASTLGMEITELKENRKRTNTILQQNDENRN